MRCSRSQLTLHMMGEELSEVAELRNGDNGDAYRGLIVANITPTQVARCLLLVLRLAVS